MSNKLDLPVDFKTHTPTLIIGLGGAGLKIINRIAANMKRSEEWLEIQNIYQFFALDTDRKDVNGCKNIPIARRFVLSNFDKGSYIEDKRGRFSKSKTQPDPRVTQWVHEWYNFRSSQGVGAGQIRVEARLSLYNAIESTDLIKRIEDAIANTIHISNANVDTRVKSMNVFLYFSVAGGTGSGSHLMMAALLRHIIAQFGWSAKITGVCILPTLFLPLISNPRQRDDILANGYSALKEVEHMMKIKVTADDPSRRTSLEFIYHPFIQSKEIVDSPFDFVYIADTTTDLFVEQKFRDVIADAMYLQMFSPIYAMRDSDYDNYEKNQKRLARGLNTCHYGSFGCCLLIVPSRDILEYCSIRQVESIFSTYLTGKLIAQDGTSFIPENDDGFKKADQARQNDIRDRYFCNYIDHEVQSEAKDSDCIKKFTMIKEKCGINPACNYQKMTELENVVIDQLNTKNEQVNAQRKKLNDNHANFESWFQNRIMDFIWLKEPKGGKQPDKQRPDQENSYFGLRGVWENAFREDLEDKLKELFGQYKSIDVKTPYSRPDGEDYYTETEYTIKKRILNSSRRLSDIDRALDHLTISFSYLYSDSKIIAQIFSKHKADIYQQRYFTFALYMELKARKTAVDLLRGDISHIKVRDEIDKYYENNRDGLAIVCEEARKEWLDAVASKVPFMATDDKQYKNKWDQFFANPFANKINQYETYQKYNFLYKIYDTVLKSVENYLNVIRAFYSESESAITEIRESAARLLRNADDADQQANQFRLDEEALCDLAGKRIWDGYYEWVIEGKVGIVDLDEIMEIISEIFSSDLYKTNYDRTMALKDRLVERCHDALLPEIVGKHKAGKESRGLDIQKALELEAELKYIEFLKAAGFWNEWADVFKEHRSLVNASPKQLTARVREFRQNLNKYSRNYLEFKLNKCVRNSQILANVNDNDGDVVEFGCRQSMMIYDMNFYGDAKEDSVDLKFPSIVKKIAPATRMGEWPKTNMAVFYNALLGVPLFAYRNVIGQCKEAYNRRVKERKWDHPHEGRQYPLHIDKNWEPDDPAVDRSKLPLALDPNEAKDQQLKSSDDEVVFFEMFIKLVHSGDILYDEEDQNYKIPQGKLGNTKGPDVILGRSPRKAVISLLSAIPAHQTIINRCGKLPVLTQEEIVSYQEAFSHEAQVDIWHDEKLETELASTIKLLQDLFDFKEKQNLSCERKASQARIAAKPVV